MEFLQLLWPTAFKVEEKDSTALIVQIIIFIVICAVIGVLIAILARMPIIGFIFSLIGGLVELYGLIGIVLCCLRFFGALK